MRVRAKVAATLAVAGSVALGAGVLAPAAQADIAPQSGDVVLVGSDTLQFALNFLADGSPYGDNGYNSPSPKNRVFSFDATGDANSRISYGSGGARGLTTGPATGSNINCGPGTGASIGTGNMNANHSESAVCILNPTAVLRAGKSPVQRPNGSGGGFNAILNDTAAGTVTAAGAYRVQAARMSGPLSSGQKSSWATNYPTNNYVSIQFGTDPFGILTSSTTNAVALSSQQLVSIYTCGGAPASTTSVAWNTVGGSSSSPVLPIIPQLGSGTRSAFLLAIANPANPITGSNSPTVPGACAVVAEENDPEAIDASGNAVNAIEPMSLSRLLLFKGLLNDGTNPNAPGAAVPYFLDPSCPAYRAASGTNGGVNCVAAGNALNPNVYYWTAGGSTTSPIYGTLVSSGYASVPATVAATGSDSNAVFGYARPLYLVLRSGDLSVSNVYQPGTLRNYMRTLFWNPAATPAPGTYGTGGAPYLASGAGQALIAAAGIAPVYYCNVNANAGANPGANGTDGNTTC